LAQFFRQVDAALAPLLRNETRPLLLAGVEYLLPIYRDVSSYAHIAGQELVGNCDYMTAQQIHDRAWPLMRPFFEQSRQDAITRYRQLAGTGKATDDLRTIVPAADEGRVETLLVDVQAVQWGRFDTSTRWLEIHERQQAGDDDLVDLATTMSLSQGGSVYAIGRDQMPTAEPAAAIFRY
jgi:hypothetical protein